MTNKFSKDFPHEGNQMFEQADQESQVTSTHGNFQRVGQVLEPPNVSGPAFEMEVQLQISRDAGQT